MAIVIDTNVFSTVFDSTTVNHAEFAAVKSWIESGDGFLLFGGGRYKKELFQSPRVMRLVRLMKDQGRAFEVDECTVDANETVIINRTKDKRCRGEKCNDQHIMAILYSARCDLFCSHDKRSFSFIKGKQYYPSNPIKVRVYCSSRNKDLLKKCNASDLKNIR